MTGIVAALPEEIAPVLGRVASVRRAGRRVWRGRLGGADVCLATTGEGLERAAGSVARFLERFSLRALIGVGIAGALSPDLREGDLLVAGEIRGPGGEVFRPDAAWLARAARSSARAAVFVSGEEIRWTASEKSAVFGRHTGAGAVAADTESAAWARGAEEARVPFVALRAILDTAAEDLPPYLREARRDGAIDRAAIVRHALRHPRAVPELLALRRRTRRAMSRLAALLAGLLSDGA